MISGRIVTTLIPEPLKGPKRRRGPRKRRGVGTPAVRNITIRDRRTPSTSDPLEGADVGVVDNNWSVVPRGITAGLRVTGESER